MVVKFESESEHQRSATSFDLLFTRALHAIEELCEGLQNVCCTYLRSQGICIFFRDRESVGGSRLSPALESLANKVLRTIFAAAELKARIGIEAPKTNWWYLADSYHEACTALAGSWSQVAIYQPIVDPDEELSVAVGQICQALREKRLLNSRIQVLSLPLLVNKKMGDRPETLTPQRHFFSYVVDAMLFAARQLGADAHDTIALQEHDKAAIENANSTFAVQEAFIRSAECILDAVWKLFAGTPRKLVDRVRTIVERELRSARLLRASRLSRLRVGLASQLAT